MTALSIGIVLHDFALGGTERIAVRLASAWAREGATVTIFAGGGGGAMRALLDPAVRVVVADPAIARTFGSRLRLARAAARHFAREPVAACFLPGNFHWPVVPWLAALAPPPAIIAQVSAALSKPQRSRWKQFFYERRMRRLLRWADAVVTLSQAAAREAEIILGRPVVRAIPLPALPDASVPPVPVPPGNRTVLAAGRLVPEKGFDLLISAFARLDDPQAHLVIVGDGPDEARLRGLIAQYGLDDRATLPGYVADTRPWLDQARLFVLSSRFEGYPAVLIEALAAGRQIVATACTPATTELIDAESGRVVPLDDEAAMAAALADLLANAPPPPELLAARVERHRIGPVARAFLALFAQVAR
jgi:glycosyltransferase involved in cell wall biosynthesis